jgi:hypothetical protein
MKTHKWAEGLLNDEWLHINKCIEQKKLIAPRIKNYKNVGKFLYKRDANAKNRAQF